MKKHTFIIATIFVLLAGTALGQKLFIRVGAGYAFPAGSQRIGTSQKDANIIINASGSYGAGFNGEIGIGYNAYQNIAVGLDISYLAGQKISVLDDRGNDKSKLKTYGQMLAFTPNLMLSVPLGKVKAYAKTGLMVALPSTITSFVGTAGTIFEDETKRLATLTFGLKGALGVNYTLNPKIGLFLEIAYISMTFRPKREITLKYTENGVDRLPNLTVKASEKEFAAEVDRDAAALGANTSPEKFLQPILPFSSIGLNFGVTISLK